MADNNKAPQAAPAAAPAAAAAKVQNTAKAAVEQTSTIVNRVTDGARDLVKRSSANAKDRTDGIYDASKKYNTNLETFLVRAAKGYTDVLGNIADAAYANVNHSIATAEKLAEAKSVSEAVQIQLDFVREYASNNLENVRASYGYVQEQVTENSQFVRENAMNLFNANKAA
ncbi:MAG: phasin family protein [Pseudomonadota bacterium]